MAELGDYVPGDIRFLCNLVGPRIGILTTIGPEHLERFKTMERIVQTKEELLDALAAGRRRRCQPGRPAGPRHRRPGGGARAAGRPLRPDRARRSDPRARCPDHPRRPHLHRRGRRPRRGPVPGRPARAAQRDEPAGGHRRRRWRWGCRCHEIARCRPPRRAGRAPPPADPGRGRRAGHRRHLQLEPARRGRGAGGAGRASGRQEGAGHARA